MKYYLSEFYKFKILIAISIILGAIAIPTVLNNFIKVEPLAKDSFKILALNHETSLKYFLTSNSVDSDIYTIDIIIKPENYNPVIIPMFKNIFVSDEQMNIVSKLTKVDKLKLQKSINILYKYPITQDSLPTTHSPIIQIILTGNLLERDIKLIINKIKVVLLRLGLDEFDYYFDNEKLIERGVLGSLKKFEAQVQQSDLLLRSDLSAEINQSLNQKQFQSRLEKLRGTVEPNFSFAGVVEFNLSGSNRQELRDFKSYMIDFLTESLNSAPTKNLALKSFLIVDGEIETETETETLQSGNRIFIFIVLGGLIGLFFSLISIYGNILRKDISKELKKSKRRR